MVELVERVSASGTNESVPTLAPSAHYQTPERRGSSYVIPIRPPFALEVQRHKTYWTIVDLETGVFGQGAEPTDAVDDFRQAVLEHLDVLQRQPELTDELNAQITYLRHRL